MDNDLIKIHNCKNYLEEKIRVKKMTYKAL